MECTLLASKAFNKVSQIKLLHISTELTEKQMPRSMSSQLVVLSVTTKRKPSTYDYYVDDQHIPRIDKQDYHQLEVILATTHQQREKPNQKGGLIKRTPQVRKIGYEILVRPTLEYATCGWLSHTKTDIQKVEQVNK